ncbi:hypothetical protein JOB18_006263 [Solea senegalensis]|uniref:Uncharacterized protein n=1 Tax=Solea senegalensis TaxID=28829 RepID=A0AAV6P9I6_SOLSE|nr:hypothetical protein JOB18_006263 [Solea senegalensis]
MHSCWSPVPKCRPTFHQLVVQLEALLLSLSPPPPQKEPLLYVNLEGEELAGGEEAGASSWSTTWQQRGPGEDKDWMMVTSGAELAIGGDYRYIIGLHGGPEQEGGGERREEESVRDEDDVVINV